MRSTEPKQASLDELAGELRGRAIRPGDEEYDRARNVFYGGIDRRPALIARVADDTDVARVVTFAREAGTELAVRSGGHSTAGHGTTDGGVVLDLADMRALEIDVAGRTAWAQTGLATGEYTAAAAAHGLATGFGDTGSVGIGGITLGGGIGFLVRAHGLTIDSLLAADVVTADGQLLRVDDEEHPDLFWAIRGGGGNFGVATRFRYRLHDVPSAVGGILILPATPDVILGFLEAADAAPDELSTIANVMVAPPMPFLPEAVHGRLVVFGMLMHAGGGEAGERAVAPFRTLAEPLADMVRPMTYPEIFMPGEEEYHPVAVGRTAFVDGVDRSTVEVLLEELGASTAMMAASQIRVLGGAMARVPTEATAFGHRDSRLMVSVAAIVERAEELADQTPWVEELFDRFRRGSAPRAYVNFLGDEGPARVREAYPDATWSRLQDVKRRYDPENVFRLNQNVAPGDTS